MNYLNKEYYNYIEKIDKINDPLHEIYTSIKELLIKKGLDKPLSKSAMKSFYRLFEIRQYDLLDKSLYELNELLVLDSSYRRVYKSNSKNKVYPIFKETPTKDDLLIYYSLKLNMSSDEIIKYLKQVIKSKKEELMSNDMEEYLGDANYLILRTKAILDGINQLSSLIDINDKNKVLESENLLNNILSRMLEIVNLPNTKETLNNLKNKIEHKIVLSKKEYEALEILYKEALNIEKSLVSISSKVWDRYAKENNGVFIHQLTGDIVSSDSMEKICVSFYSDDANTITEFNNSSIGYAYKMDINNTFTVGTNDIGSWTITKDEFINKGIPDAWQFDNSGLWYESANHTKLYPPNYVSECIKKNNSFAEIIIDNKNKIRPLYAFYTTYAKEEDIKKIKLAAKLQNLELKCLDIDKENIIRK